MTRKSINVIYDINRKKNCINITINYNKDKCIFVIITFEKLLLTLIAITYNIQQVYICQINIDKHTIDMWQIYME